MAESARAGHLRRTYGITMEQYQTMLDAQEGVCAICRTPPKPGKHLNVDHDHKSGIIRGLLCWSCNHRFIGRERDHVRFYRGGDYLFSPPAPRAIGTVTVPPKKRKRRKKNGK